ncbi:PREDICTED: putative F-box protein At3g44060 [Camelina sativa]|uniref:F-box protein At3g44060 n=1 Tax=Camelina sativa TaxID=90675 RepID=A0ABM0YX07_CAMSA|nr:PREDICTED: putative F-box protein At3g44060 [Camelina sativa]
MGHGEEVAKQLTPTSMDCLSDDLLLQILSFLPTKQAVSTSVLSKRWRALFAFTHNFGFDTYIFCHPRNNKRYKYETSEDMRKRFNDFVDRTLALQLQGGNNINKFSLKLCKYYKVEQGDVDRWICYALEHGVSDLHLHIRNTWMFSIPSKVFTSTTLVKLSLEIPLSDFPNVPDASLPALKVLFLRSIRFKDDQLSNLLLPACPVLEDLTIRYPRFTPNYSNVISSKTIKKLSVIFGHRNGDSVSRIISFDTPNVVDFFYSDYLGNESPQCRFNSLAKATLDFELLKADKQPNVRDLISGIRNVKTLHLTSYAVEVISVSCKDGLPVFNNLVDLVFSSKEEGWKLLLPRLLHRSPNLKTLILSGLDCFPCRRHRFTSIPRNNRIIMLRIIKYKGYVSELKHVRHFLQNMECLEVLKVHVSPSMDDTKKKQLTEDLLKLPTASSKLKIQVM